ncbi:demethylmenaquinone methyltransferase / 2-methoxy-6-polyprenyl-1,4-benzoquinol methylase [Abditibacterium utsteinense]|uniref:Demethylmenaquinone methyltransferase n=1 Tax=Abditibacterium utsteinense TaxID=1960156 RepID=A0A2S8SQQ7_9BACT|nr:ubiquinone/menaquinone biosynthesis methyltransferase [Abditibacterium utsteinense]PQV63137.1 demethylmenaquinone methyltransferase / 2-methoxy-6-polyprenyl-1,4-benzoquinol methylase [Abditibacterium utsteinense]
MNESLDKSAPTVQAMFSEIAGTYDLLNHVLSANQDKLWRRRAVSRLRPKRGELVLDLCCGTGDSTLELLSRTPGCRVIGADFAFPMLERARHKKSPELLNQLVAADALQLPFADASFDCVFVAFGARNFEDTRAGIGEIWRVLKPGGRLLVLEFMRPTSPFVQRAFGVFNLVLAPLGRAVSHHNSAYNYLPQSIGGFYTRREFQTLLREARFRNMRSFNHACGIATSFLALKSVS